MHCYSKGMLSSRECLEQADILEERARHCADEKGQAAFLETAQGWRNIALLACQQEAWEAAALVVMSNAYDDPQSAAEPRI